MKNKLRKTREKAGMSVAELVRQSGVSRRMLDYLERDQRRPGLDTAQRIAKVLGTEAGKIFPMK